jgi:hypothetical protein
VKQVPELVRFAPHRTSIRVLFQAENRFFQSHIPFQGRGGILGINLPMQVGKITLCS